MLVAEGGAMSFSHAPTVAFDFDFSDQWHGPCRVAVRGAGRALWAATLLAAMVLVPDLAFAQTILLQEGFEDASFSARGWYDGGSAVLSTTERYGGSRSLECRFAAGATNCPSPARHLFAATDAVYVSFYIKHSANWVGSGKSYHPHMFYFLTNADSNYVGPAYTHLTAYVEENGGVPLFAIQDGMNIDESRVGQDLTNVTEQRAVAGCNGDSDGHGNGSCYNATPTIHWNGKQWRARGVYFGDTTGSATYKGDWHLVEVYLKLNSVVGGRGVQDGIIRYWFDGSLIIDHSNVVMRTGAHAAMKFNQLFIGPWIGDGSPVNQAYWVDDLTIATGRPAAPPAPPASSSNLPAAPTNLRIIP